MKLIWILFFILGLILILVNIPVYLTGIKVPGIPDISGRIAFYIGRNMGFITGIIFLFTSYHLHIKWKSKKKNDEQQNLIDSIANKV